ncbi:MAG TPA: hypothetical protein VMZ53_17735 [Kofleriaceae bacterium]|nr:hypothetical protein [Kofleriaceae bacterium]
MQKLLLAAIASLGFTGCYTSGDVGAGYSTSGGYYAGGGGYYAEPQLYYYAPGISVVAYSDDPVFYSDGLYWRYYGNTWYSSNYYGSGWSVAYNVPYGVRSIDRPHTYAHFTPGSGWTRVHANGGAYAGGNYNNGGPVVRDHRTGYNPPARTYQAPAQSTPVVRDHRSAPTYAPTPAPTTYAPRPAPAPSGPVVRDHRRH